jgi:hypothetical protein
MQVLLQEFMMLQNLIIALKKVSWRLHSQEMVKPAKKS